MKKYLLLLATLLMSFAAIDKTAKDNIGVPGPLTFNKTSFKLAWSDKPNDGYFIQEYLPAGETVTDFKNMLTIHFFKKEVWVKDAVAQKVEELNARKKTDIVCNYQVNESPDGKELMVDFLLSEGSAEELSVIEFNVYRYKQVVFGDKKSGIVVYAFSKRAYGNDITPFLKNLKENRNTWINAMAETTMPNVKVP